VWDATTGTVLGALDGLSLRGEVRAHNVANAETPGFRASHVDFEAALSDALVRGGEPAFETGPSPTVVDARGNSVDLETELVGAMRDGLLRDAMVAAFNFKTGQLRAAISGQR
jgi:flagellar basal-body rod protein FlgB